MCITREHKTGVATHVPTQRALAAALFMRAALPPPRSIPLPLFTDNHTCVACADILPTPPVHTLAGRGDPPTRQARPPPHPPACAACPLSPGTATTLPWLTCSGRRARRSVMRCCASPASSSPSGAATRRWAGKASSGGAPLQVQVQHCCYGRVLGGRGQGGRPGRMGPIWEQSVKGFAFFCPAQPWSEETRAAPALASGSGACGWSQQTGTCLSPARRASPPLRPLPRSMG